MQSAPATTRFAFCRTTGYIRRMTRLPFGILLGFTTAALIVLVFAAAFWGALGAGLAWLIRK